MHCYAITESVVEKPVHLESKRKNGYIFHASLPEIAVAKGIMSIHHICPQPDIHQHSCDISKIP